MTAPDTSYSYPPRFSRFYSNPGSEVSDIPLNAGESGTRQPMFGPTKFRLVNRSVSTQDVTLTTVAGQTVVYRLGGSEITGQLETDELASIDVSGTGSNIDMTFYWRVKGPYRSVP